MRDIGPRILRFFAILSRDKKRAADVIGARMNETLCFNLRESREILIPLKHSIPKLLLERVR